MQLLREDNERKANVIDLHLNVLKQKEEENEKLKITIAELEAAKGEHLGTLTDELAEKEAKIIKQCDLLEEKREKIKVMKETLATKDQELSDVNQQLATKDRELSDVNQQLATKSQEVCNLEQQLKKIIIQMQDCNVAVNAKQLKIVELTEQLELAKLEVSYRSKYFILLHSCPSSIHKSIHIHRTMLLSSCMHVVLDNIHSHCSS